MARIVVDQGVFTVIDDDGGFTDFATEPEAQEFMEWL